MLSIEENRRLTQTHPATPCGELLRSFWQPIALEEELSPDRPAIVVRVMGEDLVLFRNPDGTLGLVERHCAHRGADLAFGRLEDGGIRCLYHGWLYGPDGRCREQPAEPAHSGFSGKVRIAAYPCRAHNGLVFAYLGPGTPPPFPRYDGFCAPKAYTFAFKGLWECNWLQGVEGGIDPAHVSFLHRFLAPDPREPYGQQFRDQVPGEDRTVSELVGEFVHPEIQVVSTEWGLAVYALRAMDAGRTHVRLTNLLFPNAFVVPFSQTQVFIQWHVPIDDTRHYWYMLLYDFANPVDQKRMRDQRLQSCDPADDYRPLRNRSNQWGFDPEEQRTQTFTGMGWDINTHDQWAVESAGPIWDRSREHLGAGDRAIIAYRRLLLKSLQSPGGGAFLAIAGGPPAVDLITADDDRVRAIEAVDRSRRTASPWAGALFTPPQKAPQ